MTSETFEARSRVRLRLGEPIVDAGEYVLERKAGDRPVSLFGRLSLCDSLPHLRPFPGRLVVRALAKVLIEELHERQVLRAGAGTGHLGVFVRLEIRRNLVGRP